MGRFYPENHRPVHCLETAFQSPYSRFSLDVWLLRHQSEVIPHYCISWDRLICILSLSCMYVTVMQTPEGKKGPSKAPPQWTISRQLRHASCNASAAQLLLYPLRPSRSH